MFALYNSKGQFIELLSLDDHAYAQWRCKRHNLTGEIREITNEQYNAICEKAAYRRACKSAAINQEGI